MDKVENGVYVSVDYKGTLTDGQVFDTSEGRRPLEVHMGAGQMIKGFEAELLGMALNEKKTFTLAPEDAYGERNDKLMHSISRNEVPKEMDIQIGMTVGLRTQQGQQVPAKIVQIDDSTITMDLNHPLAGESLTFEVEVVGISPTPTQESMSCDSGACGSCSCSSECDE